MDPPAPVTPPRPGRRAPSTGEVLNLIRDGRARTRGDLVTLTGLARSTVGQHVDALLSRRLLYEAADQASTGGRPPIRLAFNPAAGVVLAADVGATHTKVAVTDLAGAPLAEAAEDLDIAEGPEVVLGWLADRFDELLDEAGRRGGDVLAAGIGLPGPVEFSSGRAITPPIMPGWDGVSVPDLLAARHPVPVLVDNDVNIMALGEYHRRWRPRVGHLLFVKVGTGIGCGIVAGGAIHRGGDGAAGDIGHIRVAGHDDALCRCGNTGCLEAVAGGGAMARRLTDLGLRAENARDVVGLARGGNLEAVRLVRQAGRLLGEVLAAGVNFFNPQVVVIGGDVAHADEHLLAGVREVVYERSLPLATRHLRVVRSALDEDAGVAGAAVLALEHVLSPAAVDAAVAG
jgi:predicted NBD/HSP70 family sugar kinase